MEILYCIIEQTDDGKALRSWQQTCSTFKDFVECRNWYVRTVSGNQILVRGAIRFRSPSQSLLQSEPPLDNGRIMTLHLTTSYGTPARMEGERGYSLVALSIARMLDGGTRSIPCLKTFIQQGVLWQDAVGKIVDKWQHLSVLEVRCGTHHTAKSYRKKIVDKLETCPAAGLWLKFEGLSQLEGLRRLCVSCLLPGEGRGLAKAVRELRYLEVLHLTVAGPDYPFYLGHEEAPQVSPLDKFLECVYPSPRQTGHEGFGSGPTCGFPTSLRELSLIDETSR